MYIKPKQDNYMIIKIRIALVTHVRSPGYLDMKCFKYIVAALGWSRPPGHIDGKDGRVRGGLLGFR
jgi:hypothetical protein